MECDATISVKEISTLSLAEKDDGSAVFDGLMVDINFALFSGNTCPCHVSPMQVVEVEKLRTGGTLLVVTAHVSIMSWLQFCFGHSPHNFKPYPTRLC